MIVSVTVVRVDGTALGGKEVLFDGNVVETFEPEPQADPPVTVAQKLDEFAAGFGSDRAGDLRRQLVAWWGERDAGYANDNIVEGRTITYDPGQNESVVEVS